MPFGMKRAVRASRRYVNIASPHGDTKCIHTRKASITAAFDLDMKIFQIFRMSNERNKRFLIQNVMAPVVAPGCAGAQIGKRLQN